MGRNAVFGKHMKNEQMCQVHRYDGIMGRNKDHLFGEPVDYDQDGVKPRG